MWEVEYLQFYFTKNYINYKGRMCDYPCRSFIDDDDDYDYNDKF